MDRIVQIRAALLFGAMAAVLPHAARAQEKYPTRPITMIVPAPPGGGTDTLGRQLAEAVEPTLGTKVIVDNKPGGSGAIGVTLVTQARPDGYTVGFVHNGTLTTIQHSLQVPYTQDSYQPVVQIGFSSYVMCVAPDFPATNAKELLSEMKSKPGKYTYGNDGIGGTMQLVAERIFQHFGVKARPVPFGGAGETARNFLGGHVDIYGGSFQAILPHMTAGKAKCLLLTSADDNPAMPQASGLKALGIPEMETGLWWGLIGPKNLSPQAASTLQSAFTKAAETPSVKEALARIGATAVVRGPQEFRDLIAREAASLGAAATEIGLKKP